MSQIENAIAWAIAVANDSRYYYSLPTQVPYGLDCSTFVIRAFGTGDQNYTGAGVDTHGATDTSNMISCFTTNNTFYHYSFDYQAAKRGDVFLWDGSGTAGHTCIYLGNGQIVHAANSQDGILVAPYNPNTPFTDTLRLNEGPTPPARWHNQKYYGFNRSTNEATENALMIYSILYNLGWTLNAICGVIGNFESESGLNPWRWQNDVVIASNDSYNIDVSTAHGYGLPQFTPAGKYAHDNNAAALVGFGVNYDDVTGSLNDGTAQLNFINQYADYQSTGTWPQSYSDFKTWSGSPEDAASIWLHNYERPLSYSTEGTRRSNARYWFDLLGGYIPPTIRKQGLKPWFIDMITKRR